MTAFPIKAGGPLVALLLALTVAPGVLAQGTTADLVLFHLKPPHPDKDSIVEGQLVTFAAWVKNAGGNVSDATVSFSVDNSTLGTAQLGRMVAGGMTIVRSPTWNATAGAHRIEATVDSTGAVSESNEGNNAMFVDLRVRSKDEVIVVTDAPDYQVVLVSKYDGCFWSEDLVYTGGTMEVTGQVRYAGYPLTEGETINVTLLVDGEAIFQEPVFLAYGKTVNVSAQSRMLNETGLHSYAAVVNFDESRSDPMVENDYRTGMVNVQTYGRPCNPTATPTPTTDGTTTSTSPTPTNPTTSTPIEFTPGFTAFLFVLAMVAVVALRRRS